MADKDPGADLYVEEVTPENRHIAPDGELYLDVVDTKDEDEAVCTIVVTLDGMTIWRSGEEVGKVLTLREVYTLVESKGWA